MQVSEAVAVLSGVRSKVEGPFGDCGIGEPSDPSARAPPTLFP